MARNQKFPLAHYKVHFLERTTEEPLSQAREIRGLNMGADCEQMVEYCDKNEHGWILQMRNNADTHTRAHTHTYLRYLNHSSYWSAGLWVFSYAKCDTALISVQ